MTAPRDAQVADVLCPICGARMNNCFMPNKESWHRCSCCEHVTRPDLESPNYIDKVERNARRVGQERQIREQLQFLLPFLNPGMRILEVGCAEGSFAHAVRSNIQPIWYEAIELSRDADIARDRVDRMYGVPITDVKVDGCFDVIIYSHVFEHVRNVQKEMEAITGLLSENGIVFFEVPHGSGNPWIGVDVNPEHLHSFSVPSITKLLGTHQLSILKLETGGYESPRYTDCIRLIAKRRWAGVSSEHPAIVAMAQGGPLVVWGGGGYFVEVVRQLVRLDRISFIVDKRYDRLDSGMLGCRVYSPEVLRNHRDVRLLIGSIDYENEIRREIDERFGQHVSMVKSLSELLEVHVPPESKAITSKEYTT